MMLQNEPQNRQTELDRIREMRDNSPHLNDLVLQLEILLGHPINIIESGRRRLCFEFTTRNNGNITYQENEISICFMDDCSLAHELLHYILVLRGATLPILHNNITNEIDTIMFYLTKSVTHHLIIYKDLTRRGYNSFIKTDDTWVDFVCHNFDQFRNNRSMYKAHLLNIIDERSRISNDNADNLLRPILEEYGLSDLYDAFREPIPEDIDEGIQHANRLSADVIAAYDMSNVLSLGNLDEYIANKEILER